MTVETLLFSAICLLGFYLFTGLLVGIYLGFSQLPKLDPSAREGTLGFKVLILPGLAVFWPIFLHRLKKGITEAPPERTAHRCRAGAQP